MAYCVFQGLFGESQAKSMNAGAPQGSILKLFFEKFLIYINDLTNDLQANPKLFTCGVSLFSTVYVTTTSTVSLNHDLSKISE